VAAVSGLEVAMFNRAHDNDLLDPALTEEVFRWARSAASSPVFFFLISVPLAFVSPTLACVKWFGAVPYQALYLNPRKPADADSLLG
jgi:hypothetical protein